MATGRTVRDLRPMFEPGEISNPVPRDHHGMRCPRGCRGVARLAVVSLALAGFLVPVGCGGGSNGKLGGVVRKPALRVASVVLPDESATPAGRPYRVQAAKDGLLLVYFGYTNCPDLCPTTLADIGHAIRRLPSSDRGRVEVALVTVDPDRDTGAVMTGFLHHFMPSGHALRTSDPTVMASSQRAFNVQAKKVVENGAVGFEHTGNTYAVDEHGTVVLEWPFGLGSNVMRHDLVVLLDRIKNRATST